MRLRWTGHRERRPPAPPVANDYASFMVSERHVRRLREELLGVAHPFLAGLIEIDRPRVAALIEEFFALYPKRPVVDNAGGSRFHNCFWLHLLVRCLDPALIVESG